MIPAMILAPVALAVTACADAALTPCPDESCLADKAEADARYVRDDDIDRFAADLARAGRFAAARAALMRIPTPRSSDMTFAAFKWRRAEDALLLSEMAADTWAHPYEIASYDALDKLPAAAGVAPSDWEIASRYWLLAEKIIERFEPSLISPDLEKILRKRIVRHGHNATLDDLMQSRWPQAIEKLPERKQGELWNYVAKIYTEMSNTAAAEEMLDRAEQRGRYDSQGLNRIYVSTTHSWLRLGNIDRALNAARQAPKDSLVHMKISVARELLNAGFQKMARSVFEELETDFENDPAKGISLGYLIGIAQGFLGLGDLQEARKVTERVLEISRLPSVVPGGQLADAARAYNNIGDHARAVALLQEAASKVPPSNAVAYGISGPISGVGDSIRSEIAKEFYRAGDEESFDKHFALLPPYYRNVLQRWRARQVLDGSHPERSSSIELYFNALPPDGRLEGALDLAISAIDDDETELARKFLRRALDNFAGDKQPLTYAGIAKVAFAGGFSDFVAEALHKAAAAALLMNNRGTRATTLATVAAFQHELLDGAGR
jgi:tetratricopeptide (TPR) repeat protein